MRLPTYRPRFTVSPRLILPLAAAIVAAVGVAALYTAALERLPDLNYAFFLTAGFAATLGFGVHAVVREGHVRHRGLAITVAVLVGMTGVGASFGWDYRQGLLSFVEEHPEEIGRDEIFEAISFPQWIQGRVEMGWISGGRTTNGTNVWLAWVLEALLLVGAAVLGALAGSRDVFCERCSTWAGNRSIGITGVTAEDARPFVEAADLERLIALEPRPEADDSVVLALTRSRCPSCHGAAFFSVSELRFVDTPRGRRERRKSLLSRVELREELVLRFDEKVARRDAEADGSSVASAG